MPSTGLGPGGAWKRASVPGRWPVPRASGRVRPPSRGRSPCRRSRRTRAPRTTRAPVRSQRRAARPCRGRRPVRRGTSAPRDRGAVARRCRAVDAMFAGVSPRGVGASGASGYRWLRRYQAGGWVGLRDRPSTPKRQPRRLSPTEEAEIVAARERSGAGPLTLGAMLGPPARSDAIRSAHAWPSRSRAVNPACSKSRS